jgi:hypothetical protein
VKYRVWLSEAPSSSLLVEARSHRDAVAAAARQWRGVHDRETRHVFAKDKDGRIVEFLASFNRGGAIEDIKQMGSTKNPSKSEGGRLIIKKAASAGMPKVIQTPDDAARAVQKLIGDNLYESFFVLYVNARNTIIGHEELSEDSLTSVSVNSASIVRNALLAGAPAVVTIHNHPSGNLDPSVDDRTLWRQLREQLTVFGIVCLDNLIVSHDGFYSEQTDADQPGDGITRHRRRP